MALPSTKSQQAGGARFRQRKISVKQPLIIYKQKDLPDLSSNDLEPLQIHHLNLSGNAQQRDVHAMETGVDKNEEDEVHLQQVINAAQRALRGSEEKKKTEISGEGAAGSREEEKKPDVYIPTPDASRIWPEASKYYNDFSFVAPETYIKFSATVEDTVGVEYNMDEEDEEFLNNFNKDKSSTKICSEIEFEIICDKLEKTIEERQPFLSMDPSNILTYKELSGFIIGELTSTNNGYGNGGKYILTTALKDKLSKELNYKPFVTLFDKRPENEDKPLPKIRTIAKLFDLFGESIYTHWKERKISRHGKHIHPSLKFEDPNANEKENDADPYICFRRREFRQARKTRRADTLGAERIRLLQKSIHRAQELIENVCQREILRLDALDSEHEIFKLRSEGKNLKRTIGIKGDDYLYYSHKRKKPVVKVEEEPVGTETSTPVSKKQKKSKEQANRDRKDVEDAATATSVVEGIPSAAAAAAALQQEAATSSTQPYVKLPASKIPDMDLVTVSLVLKEKNETIKRAVLEKLRKRKEQDRHFINLTDDPYEPYFNITTNDHSDKVLELNHIPYSSITSSFYHEINNSNYISEELKKLLEENKKALPGVKTFRGSNGELIPSKPFPHILSLTKDNHSESGSDLTNGNGDNGYIAQLLSNIETNNFNAYNNGYGLQVQHRADENQENKLSEPIFSMRKRVGRGGRLFIDRRGLFKKPVAPIIESSPSVTVGGGLGGVVNVYDSEVDAQKRLDSRWRFDDDLTEYERGIQEPFSLDPSKLNCISEDTQSIRFGSMLLSKSYDLFRESVHQRQQVLIQQARARALQQQQLLQKQQQAAQAAQNAQQALQLQQQQQQAQKLQQQQQQNLLRQSGLPIPLLALSSHSQSQTHTPSHSHSPVTIPNSRQLSQQLPHGQDKMGTSQSASSPGPMTSRPSAQQRTNSNANSNTNIVQGNLQQQQRTGAHSPPSTSQQKYKQSNSTPMYNNSSSK